MCYSKPRVRFYPLSLQHGFADWVFSLSVELKDWLMARHVCLSGGRCERCWLSYPYRVLWPEWPAWWSSLFVQVQNRHCRGLCLITPSQPFISRHPLSARLFIVTGCAWHWKHVVSLKCHIMVFQSPQTCVVCVLSDQSCLFLFSRCISIFFVEFQMHFAKDYSGTAWIHSLVDCTTMLCGM